MESEFRVKDPTPAPGYPQAVISALRQTRKENPTADMIAGNLPIIGGIQAGMDATDPDASDFQRMLAIGSILPGVRLMRTIAGRLRKTPAKSVEHIVEEFKPEDIFQTPSGLGTTSKKTVADANKAYAEQLLREEAGLQDLGAVSVMTKQSKDPSMISRIDDLLGVGGRNENSPEVRRVRDALYNAPYTSTKGTPPKIGRGSSEEMGFGYTHDLPLTDEGVLTELLTSPYLSDEIVQKRLREVPEDLRFKLNALRNSPKIVQARRIQKKLGAKLQNSTDFVLNQTNNRSNLVEYSTENRLQDILDSLRSRE